MLPQASTAGAPSVEIARPEAQVAVVHEESLATEMRLASMLERRAQEHFLLPKQPSDPLPLALYNHPLAVAAAAAYRLPFVSVVIPAMNEARNLQHVLPRIPSWIHEVILVDGNSTDDTVAVAHALRPDIRIVQQQGRGKGAALRTGFSVATGEIIVMLDADGSTDPAEIPAFVGALLAGADFVKGSRFLQGGGTSDMSFHRRFGNWCFVVASRVLFGGHYSDLCYGYNAFYSHVLPQLDLDGDGFEIETMMNVRALRAGFKVAEVPSFEADRIYGESNLKAIPDGWRVLKTMLKEWRKPRPSRKLPQPELATAQRLASEQ